MKQIAAILIAIAAGLGLLFVLISNAQPDYPTAAELEAERLTIERMQAVAPAQTAAAAIWALLPPLAALAFVAIGLTLSLGWGTAALRRYRSRELVRPDGMGLLPVVYEQLPTVAPAALAGFHQTRAIEAGRQPVPHSYAPHISYAPPAALPDPVESAALAAPALPGLTDLADLAHVPTAQSILLGLGPGGERITVPMRALWHIGTAGPTGAGKSNIARLIIPQVQALGAKVAIVDPKWTPFDAEAGESWQLISDRLFMPAARKAGDISQVIGFFTEELERRLTLRNQGQKVGGPMFLYCDEYTTITNDVKDAAERVARLARLGRGVSIFLLIAAHDLLVKSGAGDMRDQIRTGYYLGGDTKTGSVLLDVPQRVVNEQESELTTGIAMLRSGGQVARMVRVPYASNRAIAGLLGDGSEHLVDFSRHTSGIPQAYDRAGQQAHDMPSVCLKYAKTDQAYSAPQSAEAARVVSMFAEGRDIAQIVADLRSVKSSDGRKYQLARAEVEALLREAMRGEGR